MRKTAVSAIALAMGVGFAGAETIDVGSFAYRASVTFPGYTLDSTLENFPVLVRLTAVEGGFSYGTASVDGSDIRFALADGTILPSEVALWNPKGESQIWVSVPVLEKETSILMYWGGERDFPASQTDGSVWSAAGYFAVWHMDEASDAAMAKDSAAGARDGTHTGTAPGQDGIAGRSVRISNGGWNVADKKGIPTASCAGLGNQFVFSLWTKYPNQNPGTDRLASNKTDWQASDGWEISTQRYSQDKIDMRGSNKDQNPQPPVVLKNTDWQHLVFVFNKATGTTYVNNSWKKDGTIGSVVDNDNIFTIGNASGLGSDSFKGWMDEVRLYKGIPGREWISAEYKSIKDTGFAAVGACESLATDEPIPGAITVASVDLHAVSLDWGLAKPGSSACDVSVAYGVEPGIYSVTNTIVTGLTASDSGSVTLENLHCGTTYYAVLLATNGSGRVASEPLSFTTTGSPVFSDVSLVIDEGTATASAKLVAPIGTASVTADARLGKNEETPVVVKSWTVLEENALLTAMVSDLTFGIYSASFQAMSHCSICGQELTVTSESATASFSGDCRWTGAAGDNCWNTPGNWSSQTVPSALDTAIFGSEISLSGMTISLGATQSAKAIRVESAGTLVFGTAEEKESGFTLEAAHLSRTGEDAGQLSIATPFVFTEAQNGTNTIVAAAPIRFQASCSSATSGPLCKTGLGMVTLAGTLSGRSPAYLIREGELAATASSCMKNSTVVGGGDVAARLTFSRDDILAGSGVGTLTVLTNGTASIRKTGWGNYYTSFVVRDGGEIICSDYSYVLNSVLQGGTISCGGYIWASGYWQQRITSEASDRTSTFKAGFAFNSSDPGGSTAVINVNDGLAPVDLVITKGVVFGGGETSKVLEKNGAGTLRLLGTTGPNTTSAIKLNAGRVLCDNTSGTPLGNAPVRVYGEAELGGCGFIGGTARGNVTVAGASGRLAVLAPGSVDSETGERIIGTFTVGTEAVTNSVTLGAASKLSIHGTNATNKKGVFETTFDRLMVYGSLSLDADSVLEVVSETENVEAFRGGVYEIVRATEGITGDFASVSVPEGSKWRINKVTETTSGSEEPIATSITLTILKGFLLILR